ncbi:hypothetical protein Tco_0115812 [Tanacetum coccineum]
MALGAKLKLGFIDGSSLKLAVIDGDYQRDLWKELEERYGQSNVPLIYHVERELSKSVRRDNRIDGKNDNRGQSFKKKKGNKNKKGKIDAQVSSYLSSYMAKETPFDFEYENDVQNGRDVVFHETLFPFKQGSLHVNVSCATTQWLNEMGTQDDDQVPCSAPNTMLEPLVPNTPEHDSGSSESPTPEYQSTTPTIPIPKAPPARRSSRSSSQPAWLKGFVTSKHKAGMATYDNLKTKHPIYPLFQTEDFELYPAEYVASLANVLAIKEPLFYSQAVTDSK